MRLLLDTHVYLWWLSDPDKLSKKARQAIENMGNMVFISAAVSWEIFLKRSIGKLEIDRNVMDDLEQDHFMELPISIKHTKLLTLLESHHNDPFDRILLAQAKAENLIFVTKDNKCLKYKDVKFLMA